MSFDERLTEFRKWRKSLPEPKNNEGSTKHYPYFPEPERDTMGAFNREWEITQSNAN